MFLDCHFQKFYFHLYKMNKVIFNNIWNYISIVSFLFVCLANPGIINSGKYSKNEINEKFKNKDRYRCCEKCFIYMPKHIKFNHCEYCKICILEKNHHDKIFGKCIGKYTHPFFIILLISEIFNTVRIALYFLLFTLI